MSCKSRSSQVLLPFLCLCALPAWSQTTDVGPARELAVAWLQSCQNSDGSWPDTVDGSFGVRDSPVATGRVVVGLVDAGVARDSSMIQQARSFLESQGEMIDPYGMWGIVAAGGPDLQLRDQYLSYSRRIQSPDGSWPAANSGGATFQSNPIAS